MNSEEKIYNKIKNASEKGEKDFPGMDKVWNRVEEKLDNKIVVKKKNTWQKVAIAATILLSFSISYHFISKEETSIITAPNFNTNTENPEIVSKDSVAKIIEKAKAVVVENETSKINKNNPDFNRTKDNPYNKNNMENTFIEKDSIIFETLPNGKIVAKNFENPNMTTTHLEENSYLRTNFSNNSALNVSSSNIGYIAPSKKYEMPKIQAKAKKQTIASQIVSTEKSDDLVVIDGELKDKKELEKLNAEDIDGVTHLKKPIYIINGSEYTEESLFGKKPTSPYAPLDKQEILTINVIKTVDAIKVYGKKGENGVIIITTKNGKPVKQ